MKNKTYRNILGFFLAAMVLFASCEKEDPIKLDAQMETWEITDITSTSANISGFVVAEGAGFTEYGICWNSTGEPTIDDQIALADTVDKAVYTAQATGLEFLTQYYVAAYVKAADGTVTYGDDTTFTTLANIATVSVDAVTNIVVPTATSGGNVTDDGKSPVTARGICWGIERNPAIDSTNVTVTEDGDGVGVFTSNITGLINGVTYYVRAYATNGIGTAYSSELSFTTDNGPAVVTTDSIKNITKTTATLYGNALFTGGTDITERGFYWGTSANPTVADNTAAAGSGLGVFEADITGLTENTTYYVRAYAINADGTAYGAESAFTTKANIITWYVPGGYVATSYPGSSFNDWDPANSPYVISTIATPDNLEGYVNMAAGTNDWKFASQPNWDGPNYGAGANPGELDEAGPNISSADGYYKVNVDLTTNPITYTAVATVWGVIGSATPGGWGGSDTQLAYDAASQTWRGSVAMVAGDWKFRANNDWGYNYGSTAGDATLDAGGSNIALATAGDYDITLDLSTPHQYTYIANLWGIIGGSVPPYDWSSDVDMTWDAGNSVFTVTLDLVAGDFKFRANDAWAYDLGGDISALTPGGANIPIAADGNYTITLNTMTMVATVTLN